jgi:polar amino acid transport system substrate-binding protein
VGKERINVFYEGDFLHGKEKRNVLTAAIDAQNSNISPSNLRLMRKNGESFPADLSATYLRDDRGKKIGIVGIIKDVTERKMLERKLIQSEKMAGIGTLAAGIAHEIRNPLTIINTSTHLLREEIIGKTEEGEDLFQQIEGGIKRMQTIVNTLLDFTRPALREFEFVDLRNLIEQVLVLEGKTISTQNIDLRADLRETPKILGNLDSLKHIFLNLLINAVQSMPEGGTLGIRTYQEDKRVKVEISDTGIGILEESLPRIFDPFFTTKEPGEGTGLGLAIVHSQIEEMGGTIRVDSKPELGSTFTVEFPLR